MMKPCGTPPLAAVRVGMAHDTVTAPAPELIAFNLMGRSGALVLTMPLA